MATTTIGLINQAPFIADPNSVHRNTGRQIDWAHVSTTDPATGKKYIPAGTVCGELISAGAGTISPRVVTTNPATCILATAAYEDDPTAAATGCWSL